MMKKDLLTLAFLAFSFCSFAQFSTVSSANIQAVQEYPSVMAAPIWNTIKTNSGYIKMGPANIGFAHIYTDRPRFIFNKDVYSYHGGFSAYSKYNLSLKTNGTTRLLIKKTNGYVGIGTTNPQARLEVNGNAKIRTDLNVLGNSTVHKQLNVNKGLELRGDLTIHDLYRNTTSKSSQLLSVNPNGLVSSIALADIQVEMYKEPCIGLSVQGESAGFPAPAWSTRDGNNPSLYTGVGCPAKVGIGTDNPSAQLHVNGYAKITRNLEVGTLQNQANSNLTVHGSVAIGTDIQNGYDLAVCGNIRAADVKVNAISDWCDYVFEEDYDLRTLQEVESFIEKNKHLPEVPSAVEVETEGIAVSEMLILMMKKIEELTLYTIEQDKRINELENKK